MAQWLVDADRVPTGRQLADGLRVVLGGVTTRPATP